MPKIRYINKRLNTATMNIIYKADKIINEYEAQGFNLTLRQLYYQFVTRNIFPESWYDEVKRTFNTIKNYKKFGSIINDARLTGHVDWYAIEDRTRNLKYLPYWVSPEDYIKDMPEWYHVDMWENQSYRPEVWIEKDALTGIISSICRQYDVPYFSCRGYSSQSAMWRAARRFQHYVDKEQIPVIFHFGDHDPSGIDMTRDIGSRLKIFGLNFEPLRLALNYDQIEKYGPPPNPVKLSDSRSNVYYQEYGDECWELDALEPSILIQLIEKEINKLIDKGYWEDSLIEEQEGKKQLQEIAKNL